MSCSCSFVIPAFNEANRLPATLRAIASLSQTHLWQAEIIVVDDGSSDNTAEVARAFSAPHCSVSVHTLPHRGKGSAIRHGVLASHGKIVVLCDADLRDSITQVIPLMDALTDGVDIAMGSRWLTIADQDHGQPLFRRFSSRAFNLLAGRILALPFKDTQCGLKALTRNAADQVFPLLTLTGWGYDPEMIHIALTLRLRVEEVSLQLVHDYADSRFRPVKDGWAAFSELFKIRWNDVRGQYGAPSLQHNRSQGLLTSALNTILQPRIQPKSGALLDPADRQLHTTLGAASQDIKVDGLPSGDQLAA